MSTSVTILNHFKTACKLDNPKYVELFSKNNHNQGITTSDKLNTILSENRLSVADDNSDEYILTYREYENIVGKQPDVNQLIKDIDLSSDTKHVDITTINLVKSYLKDETIIELATYRMLQTLGIKIDQRDTDYFNWNVNSNNKILEKFSSGINKNYSHILELVSAATRLINKAERSNTKSEIFLSETDKSKNHER